jgi:glycosyltransferase involved in cell wall biosynthesis
MNFPEMKIVIVSTYDIEGGAAKGAYRLHKALLSEGINSFMFVMTRKNEDGDYTIISDSQKRIKKAFNTIRSVLDRLPLRIYKDSSRIQFSVSWIGLNNIAQKINNLKPDIVNLNWIADGFLKIEDIQKINAPVILTLRDAWHFTGGCHYFWNCEKYISSCGACPLLQSKIEFDLSKICWLRKKRVYEKKKDLFVVGISRWITECSQKSSLLKDKKHTTIPNPVDTNTFKPIDKSLAREIWNLPKSKKIILFGAVNPLSDERKGFKQITQALQKLKGRNDLELVVFGSVKPKQVSDFSFPAHYIGYISDDISLASLYSSADLTLVPSLQENLSNVIIESLSCGTPAVAFDIGGSKDIIDRSSFCIKIILHCIHLSYHITKIKISQILFALMLLFSLHTFLYLFTSLIFKIPILAIFLSSRYSKTYFLSSPPIHTLKGGVNPIFGLSIISFGI